MGSEIPPTGPQAGEPSASQPEFTPTAPIEPGPISAPNGTPSHFLSWIFFGDQGLRAGWSLAIFFALLFLFGMGLRYGLKLAHVKLPSISTMTPKAGLISESIELLLFLLAVWIVSRIERRKLLDYNLRGPRPLAHFGSGLVTGFVCLSVLIAGMAAGGWMHFGPVALSGSQILIFAVEWGVVFLLVGCFEEGLARCYLLFTLTRGLNFWWALGSVTVLCVLVSFNPKANGLWGAYAISAWVPACCLNCARPRAGASGTRPGSLRCFSAPSTPATTARTGWASSPPRASGLSSAPACVSRVRPGGPSAATRRGTGVNRISTAPPIRA
jgi:hypothetical protein